jgi:hypothetical protein
MILNKDINYINKTWKQEDKQISEIGKKYIKVKLLLFYDINYV